MKPCKHCAELLKALKRVVTLCDDGDADELTQEAAQVAKNALKHHKQSSHKEVSEDV